MEIPLYGGTERGLYLCPDLSVLSGSYRGSCADGGIFHRTGSPEKSGQIVSAADTGKESLDDPWVSGHGGQLYSDDVLYLCHRLDAAVFSEDGDR